MSNQIFYVNIVSFIIILVILILTSIKDYKSRMVSNYYWIFLIIIGIFKLLMINLITIIFINDPSIRLIPLFNQLISILIGISIGLILYWCKLFGGADFKAVFSISLFIPTINEIYIYQEWDYLLRIFWFPVISFYLNLGIILFIYSLIIFIINFMKGYIYKFSLFEGHEKIGFFKKFIILFSSQIISFDNNRFKFYFLREKIIDGELIFQFGFKKIKTTNQYSKNNGDNYFQDLLDLNDNLKDKLQKYFKQNGLNRRYFWINPVLPLIIFITIDFVILILFGDIVLTLNYLI
ncbi:MAG: A24 family peptidase C-terminal domain-containing protein [Candidatus Helarchaeota archaeon]